MIISLDFHIVFHLENKDKEDELIKFVAFGSQLMRLVHHPVKDVSHWVKGFLSSLFLFFCWDQDSIENIHVIFHTFQVSYSMETNPTFHHTECEFNFFQVSVKTWMLWSGSLSIAWIVRPRTFHKCTSANICVHVCEDVDRLAYAYLNVYIDMWPKAK